MGATAPVRVGTAAPRVVVVTRPTDYERLLARHGTRGQAAFFLAGRGQKIEEPEAQHQALLGALARVQEAVPRSWRRQRIDRAELDRFVFEPEDLVVAVGQDGLVANAAKYLTGQVVIGINPAPERYDGVLVRHPVQAVGDLLAGAAAGRLPLEERSMVQALLGDGQRLLALNEIFVGHRTHQSARYRLSLGRVVERQSSSGLIVASGTGSTGWARSIHRERRTELRLPAPTEPRVAFLVREAFPSRATATGLTEGLLGAGDALVVSSEMNEGGVLFGDGIEEDRIDLPWGETARIGLADRRLRLA